MNQILIISQEAKKLLNWLESIIADYNIDYSLAESGISGIEKYNTCKPCLVFIDCHLKDINGMSLASIIKDTENGSKCSVYLYNTDKILRNTKADYYFLTLNENELKANITLRTEQFFDERFMKKQHSKELEQAKIRQYEHLPEAIDNNIFKINMLFSPFGELSGDGLDYWFVENKNGLYGLLFDCTGHDINSHTMSEQIRTLLKKALRLYQLGVFEKLSDVMVDINNDLFDIEINPVPTAAIIFHIDFKDGILRYCTAGIPAFYVKQYGDTDFKEINTANYLLGYETHVQFEEDNMYLENIDEIIFSSDGFSELLYGQLPKEDIAKHDDVSAIMVRLKRSE